MYDLVRVIHHFVHQCQGVSLEYVIGGLLVCDIAVIAYLICSNRLKSRLVRRRLRDIVVLVCFVYWLGVVVDVTLLQRIGTEHATGFEFVPFEWLSEDDHNRFSAMVLDIFNMILFVPLSALLSQVQIGAARRIPLLSIFVFGCLGSIFVEIAQVLLGLGIFETEDLICNVLGVVIGLLPSALHRRMSGRRVCLLG